MKKLLSLIFVLAIILSLFTSCKEKKDKFTESFIDYFDTVSTVTGYEVNASDFDKNSAKIEKFLKEYHELYDIYNSYTGINNVRTINEKAGIEPVKVDEKIINLIDYAKEIYTLTKGKTDVTLGSVLQIWHEYREHGSAHPEEASLPDYTELNSAAEHTGFDKIVVDREKSTVFILDSETSLDLGAVAKGYATEQIAKTLEDMGVTGYALNIGGNIRVIGDKPDGSKWTAAVKNPDAMAENTYLMNVNLDNKAFVTSGSYIRFYTVDGKRYHHIIDPETLYPKDEFASVSILSSDSGMADCLSTALFCMSYQEGKALIEDVDGTEAVWVTPDGKTLYSSGFEKHIVKE